MGFRFVRRVALVAMAGLLGTALLVFAPGAVPAASAAACPASVTTQAQLVDCITEYNAAAAGTTTINLGADLNLTGALPAIDNATTAELQFLGGGHTPDLGGLGGGFAAVLRHDDGNTTIRNILRRNVGRRSRICTGRR